MAAKKKRGSSPPFPPRKDKVEYSDKASRPRPKWMDDPSLLPKRPPGVQR